MIPYFCESKELIDSLINFCLDDNRLYANIMRGLQSEWVKKRIQKETEVKFTAQNLGIACFIDIACSRCEKTNRVSPRMSKYVNTDMKGEVSSQRESSWYDLNVKFCIGTLVCGLGGY